ncbi:MAG: chorismate mutase, partial [Acetobacteraceae bacterium]
LLSRHDGTLPRQAIVRIWRELLAATTAMQGRFVIAVAEPESGAGLTQAAREQFGALTPQRVHGSAAQAIADLSNGRASVAVLPLPSEGEPPGRAWWTALMQKDEPRIHVVGRLPFWVRRIDGGTSAQALVAASFAADPSGADRSLLGLELDREISRARLIAALSAADLSPGNIITRRDAGSPVAQALVEVEGYVTDDDARLTSLGTGFHKPIVLGAYAIPLGDPA